MQNRTRIAFGTLKKFSYICKYENALYIISMLYILKYELAKYMYSISPVQLINNYI
jgi:hypothetical protein